MQENQECVNKLEELTRIWFDPITGESSAAPITGREVAFKNQVVVLNSLPVNTFTWKNVVIRIMRCGNLDKIIDLVKAVINNNATINFISHESTAKALGLTPNKGLYDYRDGDVLLIFTLNKPLRNAPDVQVTTSDLDVYLAIPM
jgi:hypothetical protein